MNNIANNIKNRLSLRKPQAESLEILSEIADVLELKKDNHLETVKLAIKQLGDKYDEVKKFSDFEREFPNVCFSLATGVGKTRLMGAFITYLHLAKGINNFFVLAPNLTIYNKLKDDFGNPTHPKYVFKGISEFAINQPQVITGDNYNKFQNISTQATMYNRIRINIFNISKINSDVDKKTGLPRIKRLSEYLGESYFDHLINLPDLVLLMDESHHYRAQASAKVLNELNPVLGLEVTATPQVETSNKTIKFKNVVYEYSLAKAMKDGFVKEPAIATRKNFDPARYKDDLEGLDILKLQDGVRIHEDTKLELYKYSLDNKVKLVKPFVLVVAKDTTHADWIEKQIKSDGFFNGSYKDKVMQIHSQQKGTEKDENIQKLINLEDSTNNIEIVIHVNMLKEGWDVTNLYTIIPLRTATSSTLREQTIGRGLRLPYGQRTGDPKVDKLTIVSHDKFQEILEAARKEDSIIRQENIIEIDEVELSIPKEVVTMTSKLDEQTKAEQQQIEEIVDQAEKEKAQLQFRAKEDVKIAIFELGKQGLNLSKMTDSEIKQTAKKQAIQRIKSKEQLGFFDEAKVDEYEKAIEEVTEEVKEQIQKLIIEIPKILIVPAETKAWFEDFDIDISFLNIQPLSEEIIRKTLREGDSDTISGIGHFVSDKLENIIVNELVNIPEVNYNDCAKLLFKLANQILDKLKSYLSDSAVKSVVQYRKRDIADFIKPQLMAHFRKEVTKFEAPDVRAFSQILEHNLYKYQQDEIYDFKETIEPVSRIKTLLFSGFKKACHTCYKFDSKTEKDFAIILEEDSVVEKWLRPASNQFNITWDNNKRNYEPDFVVETNNGIYLIETKKAADVSSNEVQEKAKAALAYCESATSYTAQNGGKPWTYILLPHDVVKSNMSFDYLVKTFEYSTLI